MSKKELEKNTIFLLLALSLTFCNSSQSKDALSKFSDEFIKSKQVMAVFPQEPDVGKELYVFYNLGNKDALIKFADSLVLTVDIENYQKELKYRYRMIPHNKYKDVYYVHFIIPEGSYYANLLVTPYGVYRGGDTMDGAIYNNGNWQKGSLIEIMKKQKNESDLKDVFKEDEKLFPDYAARYGALWKMINIYGVMNNDNIQKDLIKIDSIYSHSQNFDSKVSSLIALTCGYAILKNHYESLQKLDELKSLLENSTEKIKMPDVENLKFLIDNNIPPENAIQNKILSKIFDLVPSVNSYELDNYFVHSLYSGFYELDPKQRCNTFWLFKNFRDEFSNFSNYILSKVDSTYSHYIRIDFARWVPHLCYETGEMIDCLDHSIRNKLFELGYNIGSKIDYISTNNDATAYMGAEGISGQMLLDLGESLISSGEAAKGLQYLKNYITSTPLLQFNGGSLSSSAVVITKCYLKEKNIDSAEKYLKLCFFYSSPFSYQLYDSLTKVYSEQNIQPKDVNFFAQNQKQFEIKKISPDFTIRTTKHAYNFQDFKDTLVLVFLLDNTCPSLNIGFPKALSFIRKNYPDVKVLVGQNKFEDVQKDILSNPTLSKIEFITNNDDIFKYFKINELPKVLLFKKSTLIDKINSIPSEAVAYKLMIEKNL